MSPRFSYRESVFLNCPFDEEYKPLFWAMIFAIHDCGFVARCALEVDDSSDTRISKIYNIIRSCRLGIHDISRTELDSKSKLPRFNMPLELGIFLGAKRFGESKQRDKRCLVLDRERYRFQKFCSDIAGQDIKAHANEIGRAVTAVRDWLRQYAPPSAAIPGGRAIFSRYRLFQEALPLMCEEAQVEEDELTYVDRHKFVVGWLRTNSQRKPA